MEAVRSEFAAAAAADYAEMEERYQALLCQAAARGIEAPASVTPARAARPPPKTPATAPRAVPATADVAVGTPALTPRRVQHAAFMSRARATWAAVREGRPVDAALLSPLPARPAQLSSAPDAGPLADRLADVAAAVAEAARRAGPAFGLVAACSLASLQQQQPGAVAAMLLAMALAAACAALLGGAARQLKNGRHGRQE
jgi:hypothetical protein